MAMETSVIVTPSLLLPAPERRAAAATRTERRLAAALRSGAPDAVERLHAEYGATIFGFLAHRLRDRAAAEDVFQQVLTEIWRRGPEYDAARGSLLTWAMTIARSRAIDELRRRRPEPFDPAQLPDAGQAPAHDELVERWRLTQLLGDLPGDERELLRLRFYEELSQTEIAHRTGLPLGTVKSRMVRGLERLRFALAQEGSR